MIGFMDRAFCASKVKKHTCGRELTPELKKRAEKWWGSKDYPVAYGEFCKEKKEENLNNSELSSSLGDKE